MATRLRGPSVDLRSTAGIFPYFGGLRTGRIEKSHTYDGGHWHLLVELGLGRDLLDLAGFKLDLEEVLGCKVDVVTEKSRGPYLRERIVAEARPL